MRSSLLALLFATSLSAQMPYGYEWMNIAPSPQVVGRSAASQRDTATGGGQQTWRWSVGYAVRNFEADFKISGPGIGLIAPYLGGLGDVGFYRGGSDFLNYEDGYVGPGSGNGTANWTVTSDWATPGHPADPNFDTLGPLIAIGPGLDSRGTKTFHSKMFRGSDDEAHASGDGTGFGPYVRFSRVVAENVAGSLGLSIAWTSLHGQMDATTSLGHPRRTDFIYTYDTAAFIGPDPNNSQFSAFGLVVDADAVNALYDQAFGTPGTFRNPRRSTKNYTITEWTASAQASLDVRLNEIFLSADAVWKPWRGWELGLSAGPTLNVVGTTLSSRTAWVRNDGLTVSGGTTRQSDTQVAVGVGVQGVVRYDLTRDGRAYIEAHAGYKWLNDIAIKGPAASADLDLSDWEVGLGVGIRLNDWPAGSPWSVRAGVDTRTLSFKTGAADKGTMKPLFSRKGGRGDVGLLGGRNTVAYDDGSIIDTGLLPGPESTINSGSQVNRHTGRIESWGGGLEIWEASFHTFGSTERLRSMASTSAEELETLASPSVEFSRLLGAFHTLDLGVTVGWAGSAESIRSGPLLSSVATTFQVRRDYTYTYDLSRGFGMPLFLNNGPIYFPRTGTGIIDDPSVDPASDYRAPRKSQKTSTSLVRYYAFTSASVDVSMQTLSFAADMAWQPLKHLQVALSAGPTANVVSTSTDLSTDWVRQDGALLARLQDHEEKTQLRFGLRLMASARYDLTRDGRWYAEARGGYEWMQDIDIGIGLQAASLDATSWQVGGGIGCRLGVRPKLIEIRHPLFEQKPARKP